MEVRKVVRILIFVFLVLTLLFFSLYRKESVNKSVLSEEFVSGAVLNLKNSGVTVSADIIDRNIPEKDIYVFDAGDIDRHNKLVSDAVVQAVFPQGTSVRSFEIPDGVSVGIYDNTGGSKEVGRVVFSNSDLSFSFSKSGVLIDGNDSAITNGQTESITKEQSLVIEGLIKKMSPDSSYRITGCSSNDEYMIISVMQMVDGFEICDVYMNFVFEKNDPMVISGTWITETPKAMYHNTLVDGVNVLYKLDLDVIDTVKSERIVYYLRKNESGRFFLVPGWEITYTDKDGHIKSAYFDAL